MKGFIFTGFLEMVEEKYGFVVVDNVLQKSELSTGGVYTAVGTYPFDELVGLVVSLSKEVNTPANLLLKAFSHYFFDIIKVKYTPFFEKSVDTFEMFEKLDTYIHPEVKKLYPEADLPKFNANRVNSKTLELIYSSEKMMADFAEGLMEKCAEYFGEKLTIERTNLDEEGKKVRFLITRE